MWSIYLVLFARLSVCRHQTSAYPEKKRQSDVVLNEFEWNGLKVSEGNNLKNRKFLEAIYISLFISVTYIVQCPAKNGLQVTLNTKIHLRVLVTVWPDKHEMSGRRRLNAGPTSTTLTHHRTSPDPEVGPSEDHQLSVDDLINLFTYFNDYLSILIITIITIIINSIVINAWYLSQNNTSNS